MIWSGQIFPFQKLCNEGNNKYLAEALIFDEFTLDNWSSQATWTGCSSVFGDESNFTVTLI